jgi:hypothetical protein
MPLPLPLAPDVMMIQGSFLVAVQPQPEGAVTLTPPVPPAAANDWLVAPHEKLQMLAS